ncbi:MAG: response regulator [Colwellia sp.]|nr:response regulator [Colwellia sp.]MCW8866033.1 response regulator [Colwellia sp.]MCW9081636.1 response regulator [Colwellia sp.]
MNVLVVDDKKSVRDCTSQILMAKGYNVDTAVNGLDGFEKAQQGNYQLFIIDHLMPLMNGVLLSKNIKQLSSCVSTPILFITTQAKSSVENLPEFSLFSRVLTKPINEAELLSAVSTLLPESASDIAL